MTMTRRRNQRGVILLVVLFFALLLTSTIATFLRRATIDTMIVRNRESTARAEALARGGVELAKALLLQDRGTGFGGSGSGSGSNMDTHKDLWALVAGHPLPVADGATLRLQIDDVGALLNLNAVVQFDEAGNPLPKVDGLVRAVLEKVIEEIPARPEDKYYDVAELAANLVDWLDEDDVRQRGGSEDDWYQRQNPPYRAANRPMLSVDELAQVEGFDTQLVEALRPYVTVYPFGGLEGINPNTAPPHVLALLYFDDGVSERLATEDDVRSILRAREEGGLICGSGQSAEDCTPMSDIMGQNEPYPPPSYSNDLFTVVAEARVGDVRRSIEVVVDRGESPPLLLSWRVL